MAYSSYTPDPNPIVTLDVPDDAEMQSTGVGAVNAALQDLADAAVAGTRTPVTWLYDDEHDAAETYPWYTFTGVSYTVAPSGGYVEVSDCQVGDRVMAFLTCDLEHTGTPTADTYSRVRLFAVDDYGGAAAKAEVYGAIIRYGLPTTQVMQCRAVGVHIVTLAGTTRIQIEALRHSSTTSLKVGSVALIVHHLGGG